MNGRAKAGPATTEARTPRRPGGRRWIWGLGLLAAVVATGVRLEQGWRHRRLLAEVEARVPPLPDPSTLLPPLQARLIRAQGQVTSGQDVWGGLAELGRLYHASGFPREAEVCWRLLHFGQPDDPRWCYYLADLRRTAGDYAGAVRYFTQAARLAPDYAPVWLSLAELQLKTGHLDEAEKNYRRRLALLPHDPYARLGLVRVALQQGRRAVAQTEVEKLIKDAPDFPTAHNLYAEMLAADGKRAEADKERWLGRETGRFREAADPWLDELMAWCFNYDQLCIRGTVDYQTKFGDRGQASFERAIRLRPEVLTGYELLGSLYLELGQDAKARDLYEEGLKRATTPKPTPMFYVSLSRAYRELKQPAEAVRVARQGLAQVGDAYELYDALGTALGDLGRHEEAVKALEAAVALNPNDTNSNYNLAVALLAVHRLDDAMAALHQSLVLKPTFPSTLTLLAQIDLESGRWRQAAKYLQPLYDSHPELPEAKRMMATWHLRAGSDAQARGDYAAAEQHYRNGLVIEPNDFDLQASLGALYLIQHRFADAVKPLEAYHRLRPDDPQSSLFLGQAYAATGHLDDARRILQEGVQLANRAGNAETARYCREILQTLR